MGVSVREITRILLLLVSKSPWWPRLEGEEFHFDSLLSNKTKFQCLSIYIQLLYFEKAYISACRCHIWLLGYICCKNLICCRPTYIVNYEWPSLYISLWSPASPHNLWILPKNSSYKILPSCRLDSNLTTSIEWQKSITLLMNSPSSGLISLIAWRHGLIPVSSCPLESFITLLKPIGVRQYGAVS